MTFTRATLVVGTGIKAVLTGHYIVITFKFNPLFFSSMRTAANFL